MTLGSVVYQHPSFSSKSRLDSTLKCVQLTQHENHSKAMVNHTLALIGFRSRAGLMEHPG